MHLDQGIAVTSHASQAKTVDQVIVSVPVRAFSQANEAQFYLSMSRARWVGLAKTIKRFRQSQDHQSIHALKKALERIKQLCDDVRSLETGKCYIKEIIVTMSEGTEVPKVRSIDELVEVVREIFFETKHRWWFRGHPDQSWTLLPKVRRGYTPQTERYLTNLFYQGAKLRHATLPNDDDYAGWLGLMQHYGLPTRLLDWSYSALVAVYFATKYERDMSLWNSDREAAIWLLQPETLNEAQGYGSIFPSLNARSLSDLVQEAFRDIPTTSNLKTSDVIAAVPVNRDLRMVMQHGAFTIHASDVPLETRANRHAWLRKILIPRENVAGIALSLDVLGVRLSDVFPDVDHLAIELGQMHRPNP